MTAPHWLAVLAVTTAGCSGATGPADADADPVVPPAPAILQPCRADAGTDAQLSIPSTSYGTVEAVRVHLTPCPNGQPLAILYLLHGAGADETQWVDLDVGPAADDAVLDNGLPPMAIVLPDAAPAYARHGDQGDGSTLANHLIDEIEPAVAAVASLDPSRRAIGGISRGAGFAFSAFDARPEAFVALGGHSPAAHLTAAAAQTIAEAGVPVALDAGEDDALRGNVEELQSILEASGALVAAQLSPGGHDRTYWRAQTPAYLRFYGAALEVADEAAPADRSTSYPCDLVSTEEIAEVLDLEHSSIRAGERYPYAGLCVHWMGASPDYVEVQAEAGSRSAPPCGSQAVLRRSDVERDGQAVEVRLCSG